MYFSRVREVFIFGYNFGYVVIYFTQIFINFVKDMNNTLSLYLPVSCLPLCNLMFEKHKMPKKLDKKENNYSTDHNIQRAQQHASCSTVHVSK